MKIKNLIINALLIAAGIVVGQVIPPIFFGMKPGTGLIMLFLIILFNEDFKTCMLSGIIMGTLSALTTSFPGGQFPNFIAQIITTIILYLLLKPLRNKLNNQIKIISMSLIGTFISGAVFLVLALITAGLPLSLNTMILSVVIPACAINAIGALVIYNAVNVAFKTARA